MPATLATLPHELWHAVLAYVPNTPTLLSLATVSKAYNAIVTPLIYASFSFDGRLHNQSKLEIFARAVMKNPRLAGYVTSLAIERLHEKQIDPDYVYEEPAHPFDNTDQGKIDRTTMELVHRREMNEGADNEEAAGACADQEEIEAANDREEPAGSGTRKYVTPDYVDWGAGVVHRKEVDSSAEAGVIEGLLASVNRLLLELPRLQTVLLDCCVHAIHKRNKSTLRPITDAALYSSEGLAITSYNLVFELYGGEDFLTIPGVECMTLLNFNVEDLELEDGSTNDELKHLALDYDEPAIMLNDIERPVAFCTALTSLRISFSEHCFACNGLPVLDVGGATAHLKGTLQRLVINAAREDVEELKLSEYVALKHVILDPAWLVGLSGTEKESRLVEALPESIEELDFYFEDVFAWQDALVKFVQLAKVKLLRLRRLSVSPRWERMTALEAVASERVLLEKGVVAKRGEVAEDFSKVVVEKGVVAREWIDTLRVQCRDAGIHLGVPENLAVQLRDLKARTSMHAGIARASASLTEARDDFYDDADGQPGRYWNKYRKRLP